MSELVQGEILEYSLTFVYTLRLTKLREAPLMDRSRLCTLDQLCTIAWLSRSHAGKITTSLDGQLIVSNTLEMASQKSKRREAIYLSIWNSTDVFEFCGK